MCSLFLRWKLKLLRKRSTCFDYEFLTAFGGMPYGTIYHGKLAIGPWIRDLWLVIWDIGILGFWKFGILEIGNLGSKS